MLKKANSDGTSKAKVVDQFIANHPNVSEKQTGIKINEIAVNEKSAHYTKKVSIETVRH